jgi:hypothetical protein
MLFKKDKTLTQTTSEEGLAQASALEMPKPFQSLIQLKLTGNEHEAKMAGTPNQKLKALQDAFKKQLFTEDRTPDTKPLTEVKSLLPSLDKLPETNSRVVNQVKNVLINKLTDATGLAPIQPKVVNDSILRSRFPDADLGALRSALENIANKTDVTNNIATLNNILGKAPGESITAADIESLLEGADAKDIAKTIVDSIAGFDKLTLGSIGLTEDELLDISTTLGLDVDVLRGLSFKQFQESSGNLINNYSNIYNLQSLVNSPNTGRAEKIEAYKELKKLGALGLVGEAEKAKSIIAQIIAEDKISLGGKNYEVEELLKDETISAFIQDAILRGEEGLKELQDISPALADWVVKNMEQLESLVPELETEVQDYKESTWKNANPLKTILGGSLSNQNPLPGLNISSNLASILNTSVLKSWFDANQTNLNYFTNAVNMIDSWTDRAMKNGIPMSSANNKVAKFLNSILNSTSLPPTNQLILLEGQFNDLMYLNDTTTDPVNKSWVENTNKLISVKSIDAQTLYGFVDSLNVHEDVKSLLKSLTWKQGNAFQGISHEAISDLILDGKITLPELNSAIANLHLAADSYIEPIKEPEIPPVEVKTYPPHTKLEQQNLDRLNDHTLFESTLGIYNVQKALDGARTVPLTSTVLRNVSNELNKWNATPNIRAAENDLMNIIGPLGTLPSTSFIVNEINKLIAVGTTTLFNRDIVTSTRSDKPSPIEYQKAFQNIVMALFNMAPKAPAPAPAPKPTPVASGPLKITGVNISGIPTFKF